MADPAAVLDAFARDRWNSNPFEQMLALVKADPANAFHLLQLAIHRGGESATFMDAAVSYVPEHMLQDLADQAASAFLHDSDNEVAESVIHHLSLQAVACLQPHLKKFYDTTPNADSFYVNWPWRGASDDDIALLLALLQAASSPEERERAFERILESRNPSRIAEALKALGSAELPRDTPSYLEEVGFDGPDRPLFPKSAFHIRLPAEMLADATMPVWLQRTNHPTWSLPANDVLHRLGGFAETTCAVCEGKLHNLIAFDPTPDGLDLPCPPRLQIVTCLSCLGWSREQLFFQHDANGTPTAMASGAHEPPKFPAVPLRETQVGLSQTPPRWQRQGWKSSENLHRIGGYPTWVQSAAYPTCPSCDRLMPMLLQLDSELPTEDGDGWLWGSGGLCYVFWCGDCSVSASLWQCT